MHGVENFLCNLCNRDAFAERMIRKSDTMIDDIWNQSLDVFW